MIDAHVAHNSWSRTQTHKNPNPGRDGPHRSSEHTTRRTTRHSSPLQQRPAGVNGSGCPTTSHFAPHPNRPHPGPAQALYLRHAGARPRTHRSDRGGAMEPNPGGPFPSAHQPILLGPHQRQQSTDASQDGHPPAAAAPTTGGGGGHAGGRHGRADVCERRLLPARQAGYVVAMQNRSK